jgi:hypothetical protein
MIRKILAFTATALPLLAVALTPSSASAQSFTGNYMVSVTETKCGIAGNIKCGNQSYCLELTDDGSFGRPNSGSAALQSSNSGSLSGSFQVIGNTIVATLQTGSATGEVGGVVPVQNVRGQKAKGADTLNRCDVQRKERLAAGQDPCPATAFGRLPLRWSRYPRD